MFYAYSMLDLESTVSEFSNKSEYLEAYKGFRFWLSDSLTSKSEVLSFEEMYITKDEPPTDNYITLDALPSDAWYVPKSYIRALWDIKKGNSNTKDCQKWFTITEM